MNELPAIFESFTDARKNGFLNMKRLKEEGKKVVGIFCTYTPRELIYAAGLVCVPLCSTSDETIPAAEEQLPKNLCPLIKASYGFAVTDKCPYMYFSDLIVGETTCDGKKKMYELLGEKKDVYVMQLPQMQNERSAKLWREELAALKEKLESTFNVEITTQNLQDAIRLCNEEREAMARFYELGKLTPPPISGFEIHTILNGSTFNFDKQALIRQIKEMTDQYEETYRAGKGRIPASAPRILITGCPSGGVVEKVIRPIEEAGAVAVCYENCVGIKSFENLVEINDDPLGAIAERYLKISCSVMTPNPTRKQKVQQYIQEYQVDGVVDVILTACHTYNVETELIKQAVTETGASYLALETDYSSGDFAQVKIRLEAFVEMLKLKCDR